MTPREDLAVLAQLASEQVASAPPLALAYAEVAATPYRFDVNGCHVRWDEVRRRGYAACGEAAAFLAAAAAREGREVSIQLVTGDPGECGAAYRHAVAVVDGEKLDPYKGRSCPAPHIVIGERWL